MRPCFPTIGFIVAAFPSVLFAQTGAQSLPTATPYTSGVSHDKRHVTYTVERDGSYVKEVELQRLIESDAGVRAEGQQIVPYSASLQSVEILQARVITAKGEIIDVQPSAILDQQPYLSQGAPAFSDNKSKAIIFPQVSIGARTLLHYRITQKKPILPGHFSAIEFASPHDVRRDVIYTVIAPASMPMQVQGIDLPIEKIVLPDGRLQWRAHTTNAVAIPPEAGSVAIRDYSQRFVASSLPSGESMAQAYRELVGDLGKPTPKVEALARSLTKGITDPREQAKALYDWVRTDIRYVAIVLERGGWQPHAVDSIIAMGYGDCKDKAILLGSLLEAMGIASTPVLVNAGSSYWMPEVPTLQSFNHMISYVPTLGIYLDSTERWAPFGVLPSEDANKRVLHLSDGTWAMTPESEASAILRHQASTTADNRVIGQFELTGKGSQEVIMGRAFAGLGTIPDSTLMPPILNQMQVRGEGRLRRSTSGATRDTASIAFDYSGIGPIDLSAPGATRLPLSPFVLVSGAISAYQTPRKFPFLCPSFTLREEFELEFPVSLKIVRNFPAVEQVAESGGARMSYIALTAQDGTRTMVTRQLVAERLKLICTAEDQARWQSLIDVVQRNSRAQMLYE